jgi:glucose-6-phosphate isomerase
VTTFSAPPLDPLLVTMDVPTGRMQPAGPTLVRRMSDLEGLFADEEAWRAAVAAGDPVVYEVSSSPVPEVPRELPHSITTIYPGACGGELHMTKGHQHPDPQGEIYLGLSGVGGLLMSDGQRSEWLELRAGSIGYIPPGWAHRSVNTHDEPYRFLAVYPGAAGHDYEWVLRHGMGRRVYRRGTAVELVEDIR